MWVNIVTKYKRYVCSINTDNITDFLSYTAELKNSISSKLTFQFLGKYNLIKRICFQNRQMVSSASESQVAVVEVTSIFFGGGE